MVQQAVEECRRIHGALRPARLGYGGVVAALQSLCGELREAIPQVTTEEQLNVVEADLPEDLKVVIYRICQEALRNAIEHSGAGRVMLSLGIAGGVIDLSIRDNGHGFDPGHLPLREGDGRGVGLVSMRERADMSGGLFSIQSKPGAEAAVTVQWRLQSRAAP
jgi:signal transduction histidine kinase